MKRNHSFTHEIEFEYSDDENCNYTGNNITSSYELQKVCKGILGRECESNDIDIYHDDVISPLSDCKKWYSIPFEQRKLRFSNHAYSNIRPPHIKYIIDPYYTKVSVLGAKLKEDRPIYFCIDTGNESPSSIVASRFEGLIISHKMATTDMIFAFNMYADEKDKIVPVYGNEDDFDIFFDYDIDLIQNIEYPKITQKELREKCDKYISRPDYEEMMKIIKFEEINGVREGVCKPESTTKIRLQIEGIDKIFKFKCNVDESISPDIILGYQDISILYENGIDIGFNPNILENYRRIENELLEAKNLYNKVSLYHVLKKKNYYHHSIERNIDEAHIKVYNISERLLLWKSQRFPAYKI